MARHDHNEPDVPFQSEMGITEDFRFILQFNRPIRRLLLSPLVTMKFAASIIETVQDAAALKKVKGAVPDLPDGKLLETQDGLPADEAPLAAKHGITDDGKVLIELPEPVEFLTFGLDEALDFAEGLVEAAREAAGGDILVEAPKVEIAQPGEIPPYLKP